MAFSRRPDTFIRRDLGRCAFPLSCRVARARVPGFAAASPVGRQPKLLID